MNSITKTILLFHLFLSVTVAINVTCDRVNPLIQSDVACTCKTAPGTDIDWLIDDVFNSNCVLSSKCAPQYSGYSYSMNTTENVFMMTINAYDYSSCTKITCKDESDGSIKQSIIPSSLVFDKNFPTSMTEPGSNNNNGIISVTTGCISGFLDVQYDWYIIVDGLEERYAAHDTIIIDTIDKSLCVNCDTDVNGQRTIGFEHTEASGYGTKTGRFKVYLYHDSTNLYLNLTSKYYFTVSVSGPIGCVWVGTDYVLTVCIGITFCLHHIAAFVMFYFTICQKDLFFRSTYANTGLISAVIIIGLALCIVNWKRCSCTNPCPSCEYMCILRYIWIGVVLVNWSLGFYRLHKIRKLWDKKDFTGDNEKRGVIYLVEDTEFLISLFCFIILTYVLLLIVWIFYKIENEDGKNGEDKKITNKDNLEHSGGQNGAKNGKSARDPSSETAHDLNNRNDNKSVKKHYYDEKAQNSDKYQGQKAHDPDKRNDNKSGPEQEDIIKNFYHDKAHGQNSDENQDYMADVHRTKIFVTRPAQSNIVVQPLDDNIVQKNSADKQSSKLHNYIPRGISTLFNDPDDNDPQPAYTDIE